MKTLRSVPENIAQQEYELMRPYRDDEINAAMRRIVASAEFDLLAGFVYPDRDRDDVARFLLSLNSIDEFQLQVMAAVNQQIIARSITSFSYDGFERLDPARRYLFVSNHRDIMLDSSLLQYALWRSGHATSEITFGANLMTHPTVIDIGKSNKMFRVERGGSMRDFYRSSLKLSSYLRHTLLSRGESIWIAQRNGRTKDGLDRTEPGLISMFGCSRVDDRVESLAELNIVPVSISYEWETCDRLKARELALSAKAPYIKQPDEDLRSILQGIVEPKGRVHIAMGTPLDAGSMRSLDRLSRQDFVRGVAAMVDEQIIGNYRLWPSNYVAADKINGDDENYLAGRYNSDDLKAFERRLNGLADFNDVKVEETLPILLGIYANPLFAKNRKNS